MIEKCKRLIYGLEMTSRVGEPVTAYIIFTQKRFWKHPVGGQRTRQRITYVLGRQLEDCFLDWSCPAWVFSRNVLTPRVLLTESCLVTQASLFIMASPWIFIEFLVIRDVRNDEIWQNNLRTRNSVKKLRNSTNNGKNAFRCHPSNRYSYTGSGYETRGFCH
jgi:hypothetical protein